MFIDFNNILKKLTETEGYPVAGSQTNEQQFNPFDVYNAFYSELNNGEESELNYETFNKIMSGEIESDDELVLNVIQATQTDEDKENVSLEELEAVYGLCNSNTSDNELDEYINMQFEEIAQMYLGKSASECTSEELNQAYALSIVEEILLNSQAQLAHQDKLDGKLSEAYDAIKELCNTGTCQKNVEEALAFQEDIINNLKNAILEGDFEEKYKELTGVEFDAEKIIEYRETTQKIELLELGINNASNFIENVSLAENMEDVLNLYMQYYKDENIAKEKLNSFLIQMQEEHDRPAIGFIDENNNFIIQYYDSEGNIVENATQTLPLNQTKNWLSKIENSYFQSMPEVKDFVANFEKAFNINSNELVQYALNLSQETFGEANKATELLAQYIQEQESFLDKQAQTMQYVGMGLMLTGILATFIAPSPEMKAFGGVTIKVGQGLSIGGVFGDNIAEAYDLSTNDYLGAGEYEAYKSLLNETITDGALFTSGYIIGGISNSIADDAIKYFKNLKPGTTSYSVIHNLMEVPPDAIMSLTADYLITGEVDAGSEGISQILGILTGTAFAKLNNTKVNTQTDVLQSSGESASSASSSSLRRVIVDVESQSARIIEQETPKPENPHAELSYETRGDSVGTDLRVESTKTQGTEKHFSYEETIGALKTTLSSEQELSFRKIYDAHPEIVSKYPNEILELIKLEKNKDSFFDSFFDDDFEQEMSVMELVELFGDNLGEIFRIAETRFTSSDIYYSSLIDDVETIAKTYREYPDGTLKLVEMQNTDGSYRFDYQSISWLIGNCQKFPNETLELVEMRNSDGSYRFSSDDLKSMIEASKENLTSILELAKLTNADGNYKFNTGVIKLLAPFYKERSAVIFELAKIEDARITGEQIYGYMKDLGFSTIEQVEALKSLLEIEDKVPEKFRNIGSIAELASYNITAKDIEAINGLLKISSEFKAEDIGFLVAPYKKNPELTRSLIEIGASFKYISALGKIDTFPHEDMLKIIEANKELFSTEVKLTSTTKDIILDKLFGTNYSSLNLRQKMDAIYELTKLTKDETLNKKVDLSNIESIITALNESIKKVIEPTPVKQEAVIQMMSGFFANNNPELDYLLSTTDFAQFGKSGLPLAYSRQAFIEDLSKTLESLPEAQKAEILKKLGITLTNNASNIGYNGIIDLSKLSSDGIEGDVLSLATRFIKENSITTGDSKLDKALNSLIQGMPEFINIIGKQQHSEHNYSVDIHMLTALKEAMNNSNYESLSNLDKFCLKFAIILHDIAKAENTVDDEHAEISALYARDILNKDSISLPIEVKDRIYELIKNHHWLEKISKDTASAGEIATYFRRTGDLEIAQIMAEADLKAVNRTFFEQHGGKLEKVGKIRTSLQTINQQGQMILTSKIIKLASIPTIEHNGKQYRVINFTEPSENFSLEQYGFEPETTRESLRLMIHMVDEKNLGVLENLCVLQDPSQQGFLCASYVSLANHPTYGKRRFGVSLEAEQANIANASTSNQSSGFGKNFSDFTRFLTESLYRDQIPEQIQATLGISSKEEYSELFHQLQRIKYASQLEHIKEIKVGDKTFTGEFIKTAILAAGETLIGQNPNTHSEINLYSPKINAVVAKVDSLNYVPQEVLDFAEKHNLPIFLIGK